VVRRPQGRKKVILNLRDPDQRKCGGGLLVALRLCAINETSNNNDEVAFSLNEQRPHDTTAWTYRVELILAAFKGLNSCPGCHAHTHTDRQQVGRRRATSESDETEDRTQ